jgi:hypothetical protein
MTEFNGLDVAYVVAHFGKDKACEDLKAVRESAKTTSDKPKRAEIRTKLVEKFAKWLRSKFVPQWDH